MTTQQGGRRRLLHAVVGITGLVKISLVVWVGLSWLEVRKVWPALDTPAVEPDPGPFIADGKGMAALEALVEVASELDRSGLKEAIKAGDTSAPLQVGPEETRQAVEEALDALLACDGLDIPPSDIQKRGRDGQELDLRHLRTAARLRLLRAEQRAAEGHDTAAAEDLTGVLRLGVLLQHSGGYIVSVVMGLAIQNDTLDVLERILDQRSLSPEAASVLAAGFEITDGLPSGVARGLVGECGYQERLLHGFASCSTEELFDDTVFDGPGCGEPGEKQGGGSWLFDVERTRAMLWQRCAEQYDAAREPVGSRDLSPRAVLLPRELDQPGVFFDNPVGRLLIDMTIPLENILFEDWLVREDEVRGRLEQMRSRFASLR